MDLQMPVMDGMRAVTEWRRRESEQDLPRTPIVAVTASALAGDEARCRDAGMDDYLAKPFRIAELSTMLRRWLGTEEPVPPVEGPRPIRPHAPGPPASEATVAGDEPVVLDAATVESLRSAKGGGSEVLWQRLVGTFREHTPARLNDLTAAVEAHDLPRVKSIAHSLKSGGGMLGARRFQAHCAEIESRAASGDADRLPDLLDQLRHAFEAALVALASAEENQHAC
jgi:CheY-like chemotaxis protein